MHAAKYVVFLGVLYIFVMLSSSIKLLHFVLVVELLDVLPSKRKHEDDSDSSDESSEDDQDELDVCT